MSRRTRVILRDTPPSRNAPTGTGTAFLASIPEKGVYDPLQPCRSMTDVEDRFGTRQSYSVFYDWCETFFREGGALLHVSPVRGPNPVKATLNLASTGTTLVVTAKTAGEWANGATGGLTAEVVTGPSGGTFREIIIRLNGVEVERTPEFSDRADAVAWSSTSDYVDIALGGGSGQPTVAAAANLTGGTLDRANITQTQINTALALMSADLGPGNVVSPDWVTEAATEALLDHAEDRNRFALCDTADTTSKSTLLTAAGLVQGHANSKSGALLAPWITIQGTSTGTTRSVPPSAFVAAKAAQTDALAGANQAPAGSTYGIATSSLVTGVKATYSDADAEDLEDAGVNLIISRYGNVLFDGNRTLVEPLGGDSEWLQIGTSRFRMQIVAEAAVIGETFEHQQITPVNIARFDHALTGMMLSHQASLFPGDDDPGFIVDTETVNTAETIEDGELIGAIGFRPAPGADLVTIYLSKVAVGDPVA